MKRFALPRLLVLLLGCLALPGSSGAQAPQPVPATGTVSSLVALPEKELFKRGEKAYTAGRWEEAYRYLKEALKKRQKEHSKYSPMYEDARNRRADEEAAKGEGALALNQLESCEAQIGAAKGYAATAKTAALESAFNARLSELRGKFTKASSLASENAFEQSLEILNSLLPYEKYVPGVAPKIELVNRMKTDHLIAGGRDLCAKREWLAALKLFQEAKLRDPSNEQAQAGLERADRGIMADRLADGAREKLDHGLWREALYSIEKAIEVDPDSREFLQPQKNLIVERWLQKLQGGVPRDAVETGDFYRSRDVFNALETMRELQPENALAAERLPEMGRVYGTDAWVQAGALYRLEDKSRVATAYALLLGARDHLGNELIRSEQILDAARDFNKKRAVQVIVSVDNSCAAPAAFIDAIRTRAISSIEKLGIPDVWVRTREEYNAAPREDTQYQGLRPDGKSYLALLNIEVLRHQSEVKRTESVEKSRFTERMETVRNPEYDKLNAEVTRIIDEIDSDKSKVPEKDRYRLKERERERLKQVSMTIESPVTRPYEYKTYAYDRKVEVTLTMNLKDRLSNTFMTAGEEIRTGKSDKGNEVTGVHPQDVDGRQNLALKMATPEEALGEAEREAGETLGRKMAGLLDPFLKRFLQEGKTRMEKRQLDEAVEALLCYWTFVRGNVEPEDSRLIRDLVRQETGLDLERRARDFLSIEYINPGHTAY